MKRRELSKLIVLYVVIAGLAMLSVAWKARAKQPDPIDVVIRTGVTAEYVVYRTAQSQPKIEERQVVKETVEDLESKLNLTENERYLICKLAYAEAGNQDTEGKALVMKVVLNRVQAKQFPNTIEKVIYQKYQFSPVGSSKWNSFQPNDDCYKALEMIENGYNKDQGALYFESKSQSTWHKNNLKFLFKHQDHYFYKEKTK